MLSQNLQTLFRNLNEYVDTGAQFDGKDIYMICANLEAAIDDARELENRAIPVSLQNPDNADYSNVARLVPRKNIKPCLVVIDPNTGGDVA